jgi:uncharacterized protein YcnI
MMVGMRRRTALIASLVAALAVAAPFPASAHLAPEPTFLAVGGKQRIALTVHNDRDEEMTGFRLSVPAGLRVLGTGGASGWNETVEGDTASWTGGSLDPDTPVTFEFDLEAAAVAPGTVELEGDQLYADDESVRWPLTLTVIPPGASAPEEDTGLGATAVVVLAVLGALVVALFALVFRQRRRTLQEK